MKQKLLAVCLCLVLLLGLSVSASADMLWEPWDNDYFISLDYEYDDYLDRTYTVPEGMTANVYKSPETGGVLTTLSSGDLIYVGPVIHLNGITWAAGYPYGDWDNQGWVNLDRLQRTYEHEDFVADFEDSFEETDDILTQDDITTEIQTWTYPGSGLADGTIPRDCLGGEYNNGVVNFSYIYTDPDGGRWGYVGYYMGRCGWVWLDDPEATETPLFVQTPENTVKDSSEETRPSRIILPAIVLAAIFVLVLGTAAIFLILRIKKKPHGA